MLGILHLSGCCATGCHSFIRHLDLLTFRHDMEPYGADGAESECNCNDSDDSWGSDIPWDAKPAVSRDTSFKAWKR